DSRRRKASGGINIRIVRQQGPGNTSTWCGKATCTRLSTELHRATTRQIRCQRIGETWRRAWPRYIQRDGRRAHRSGKPCFSSAYWLYLDKKSARPERACCFYQILQSTDAEVETGW